MEDAQRAPYTELCVATSTLLRACRVAYLVGFANRTLDTLNVVIPPEAVALVDRVPQPSYVFGKCKEDLQVIFEWLTRCAFMNKAKAKPLPPVEGVEPPPVFVPLSSMVILQLAEAHKEVQLLQRQLTDNPVLSQVAAHKDRLFAAFDEYKLTPWAHGNFLVFLGFHVRVFLGYEIEASGASVATVQKQAELALAQHKQESALAQQQQHAEVIRQKDAELAQQKQQHAELIRQKDAELLRVQQELANVRASQATRPVAPQPASVRPQPPPPLPRPQPQPQAAPARFSGLRWSSQEFAVHIVHMLGTASIHQAQTFLEAYQKDGDLAHAYEDDDYDMLNVFAAMKSAAMEADSEAGREPPNFDDEWDNVEQVTKLCKKSRGVDFQLTPTVGAPAVAGACMQTIYTQLFVQRLLGDSTRSAKVAHAILAGTCTASDIVPDVLFGASVGLTHEESPPRKTKAKHPNQTLFGSVPVNYLRQHTVAADPYAAGPGLTWTKPGKKAGAPVKVNGDASKPEPKPKRKADVVMANEVVVASGRVTHVQGTYLPASGVIPLPFHMASSPLPMLPASQPLPLPVSQPPIALPGASLQNVAMSPLRASFTSAFASPVSTVPNTSATAPESPLLGRGELPDWEYADTKPADDVLGDIDNLFSNETENLNPDADFENPFD